MVPARPVLLQAIIGKSGSASVAHLMRVPGTPSLKFLPSLLVRHAGPAPWQASRLHWLLLARQRTWPSGRHAAALTATLHDGRIASCSSNDQCAYRSPVVISPNRYSTWQARARLPSPLTAVSRSGAPAWPVILVRRAALRRSCNAFNCNYNAALYDVETIARAAPAARYIM